MTKAEALDAAKAGHKVRHILFTQDEWMTIDMGMLLFEDGCRCSIYSFFNGLRSGACWNDDWSFYELNRGGSPTTETKP